MATKSQFTLADYLALDEPDGPHYELSDGELVVTPSTAVNHNDIRDRLNARMRAFVEPRHLGEVTSETDFQLGSATVRRPDVALILAAHFRPEYCHQVPIPIAPDLAIEVVSDHDRAQQLTLKTRQYLAAGTVAVWLLYPRQGLAYRHTGAGASAAVVLAEPDLLPGFSLPLAELLAAR